MRIAMTGATGLIGSAIGQRLRGMGHELVILTRSSRSAERLYPDAELISWDAISEPPPARFLQGAEAVIHLVGESLVGGRWTKQRKEAIRDSRAIGTRNLTHALVQCDPPPKVLLSGSAIGFYGDRGDEELDESSQAGKGFLADVGRRWESEAQPAIDAGIRVAFLRTGVVLSDKGGALQEMVKHFRRLMGGRIGNGKQWMSWIHIEDHLAAMLYLLENESLSGPVNLTSPKPVTNRTFTSTLSGVLGKPALFPVPRLALKMRFGELAQEALLAGQRVLPRKLRENGFHFRYAELEAALNDLLKA